MRLFLILVLIVNLLLWPNFSLAQQSSQDRIDQLRAQIQELESRAQQYRISINRTQQEGEGLKKEIAALNNQLNKLLLQIKITSNKIEAKELEVNQLQDQIGILVEKINKSRLSVGQLLRSLEEIDSVSLVVMILKHPQLSDIFNQLQSNDNLQESLIAKINALRNLRQDLGNKKSIAEEKQKELEQLKLGQQLDKKNIDNIKGYKSNLLQVTKGQEAKYTQLLTEAEKKKSDFFKELQQLELRARGRGEFIVHVTAKSVPPKKSKIFQWPEDDYILTQGYGYTKFAKRGAYGGAPHNGIDMASGYGSEIKSIGQGVILASGNNNGWGNWAAIRHENDLVSLYGHMSAPTFLNVGQRVQAGAVIGYEGATGNSTGPHLHLSLYKDFFTYVNEKNGQLYFNYFEGTVNPLDYL